MGTPTSIFLVFLFAFLILAESLGVYYFSRRWYKKRLAKRGAEGIAFVNGVPSPLLTLFKTLAPRWTRMWRKILSLNPGAQVEIQADARPETTRRPRRWMMLEIVLIVAWAVWVGRDYVNFNPLVFPQGGDYNHQIYNLFTLNMLPRCGMCALWNGYIDGGQPALADWQGAAPNPLVIFSTLLLGVVNGSKFYLLCSLVIAGLAQWWLARVMGLGWVARLWAGIIVVVCGHLGPRLENGVINVVLATAFASLFLAPAVDLAANRSRKAIVWMGLALALTLLSGQGYIQIALVVGILPVLGVFVLRAGHPPQLWRDYVLAGVLALLLAGYFLVPALHFFPSFTKESEGFFNDAQSLFYMPLNFITAANEPTGLTRNLFVGWVPLILAVLAVILAPRSKGYLLWFFLIGIAWLFLLSSAEFLKFMANFFPQVTYLRFPNFINGMAAPLLLGLAAWGLDRTLMLSWPKISLIFKSGRDFTLTSSRLLAAIPLALSVLAAYPVARTSMFTDVASRPQAVIQELTADSANQWVQAPTDDFYMAPVLIQNGVTKITGVWRPFGWISHDFPEPYKEAFIPDPNPDGTIPAGTLDGYNLLIHPENQYAVLQTDPGSLPCQANAQGGTIDVTCSSLEGGYLVVHEHSWTGWYVWADGVPATLDDNQWLGLYVEGGTHTYQFRYLPWDVPAGFLLTLAGLALALWLLLKK